MKCELCNGKGVINDADTLYGVRYCPQCDAGNLQLRLDHKFLPVIEEDVQLLQQIEASCQEPNPIYQDIPFMPTGGSLQNQDWTPGRRVPTAVQERKLNAFIEGKPVSDDEAREYRRTHPDLMLMPLAPSEQKFSHELDKPPAACQQQMIRDGRPHPRSCSICGLGPCKWYAKPSVPPAVQEFNDKRGACSRCIGTGWVQVAGSTSPCPKCRRVVLSKLGGTFEFDSYTIIERDAFDSFKPGRDVA